MLLVPLATSCSNITQYGFWQSILRYHDRAHLINRRLVCASQILFYKTIFNSQSTRHVSELFTKTSILYEVRKLKQLTRDNISEDFIRNIIECYDKNVVLMKSTLKEFKEDTKGIFISVRLLMPRQRKTKCCIEIVVLDKQKSAAQFIAVAEQDSILLAPPFPYEFVLTSDSKLKLNLFDFEDADTSHADWLAVSVFPKVLRWAEDDTVKINGLQSLSLISADEYCLTYGSLKDKYGNKLVEEWPKVTTTNPQKYIFEDIAIASYLICLWKKYTSVGKVNFVDCGCGNGLLVYILNQEGYKGYGIDVRKRPVWDIYPPDTNLEVGTVTPSSVFPDCTWIIGNHSDELTPWIPVISLRSSLHTNFFILPCCPYDFSGQKYARTNTSVSQYSDYLSYIENICTLCGFTTKLDKLRIPSTKRTCLVGLKNTVTSQELDSISNKVNSFVESRLSLSKFIPRTQTEKVRNCTQLARDLTHRLVFACVTNLLIEEHFIEKPKGGLWNKGSKLTLADLSQRIPSEDLKQMKKECGGLQTLLRNHRYIFEVNKGSVVLRQPLRLDETTKRYKNKPCWFVKYHPNGCLYDSKECAYQHSDIL